MSYNDKAKAIQWKEIAQDDQDDEVRYSASLNGSDLSEKDIEFEGPLEKAHCV